jgi:hypothetical protein
MVLKLELKSISDDELLRRLSELLKQSRRVEAELVAHIGEVDARRLYARNACSAMFVYCTEVLHLSEAEAYLRIVVARAARQHPILLEMLGDGRLHLSGIERLAPHLTESNRDELLARAAHKTKRQIEELIVELKPKPDVPTVVRKLPRRRSPVPSASRTDPVQLRPDGVASQTTSTPTRQTAKPVEPLAPARYKVQFTADATLHEKLQRLCTLTGAADLAAVIAQAVTEKLERLEARRFAKTERPRQRVEDADTSPSSRHIPAAIKRAVLERDGNRCSFVDEHGKRCTERDRLEFHHKRAYGRGGDHRPENISLMCKAHNLLLAEEEYGSEFMQKYRRSADRVCEPQSTYGQTMFGLKTLSLGRTFARSRAH